MKITHKIIGAHVGFVHQRESALATAKRNLEDPTHIEEQIAYRESLLRNLGRGAIVDATMAVLREEVRQAERVFNDTHGLSYLGHMHPRELRGTRYFHD